MALQKLKLYRPVYKADQTNRVIEVGESVALLMKDGSSQSETLTAVREDGRVIEWEGSTNGTFWQDVQGVSAIHSKDCDTYYGGDPAYPEGDDFQDLLT